VAALAQNDKVYSSPATDGQASFIACTSQGLAPGVITSTFNALAPSITSVVSSEKIALPPPVPNHQLVKLFPEPLSKPPLLSSSMVSISSGISMPSIKKVPADGK
jgi:hypothetical protein